MPDPEYTQAVIVGATPKQKNFTYAVDIMTRYMAVVNNYKQLLLNTLHDLNI